MTPFIKSSQAIIDNINLNLNLHVLQDLSAEHNTGDDQTSPYQELSDSRAHTNV